MNIAEFFVTLGIKGGKEAQSTLKGVKGGMKDVKSMGLEAKAAILAVTYGLYKLTNQSMLNGTALAQFNNLTGLSTKKLQQWQYANKIAGGSAEEITGAVTGMQSAFAAMDSFGEAPPKFLGMLADGLEAIGDSLDVTQMKDSFYLLEKLRSFYAKGGTGNIGKDNLIGESMGLTPNMIGSMRAGQFDESILAKANITSERQAKELQRLNGMWVDLGDSIQKQIGRLNAQFGGELVTGISKVTKEVATLVGEIIKLTGELHVFEAIAAALKGAAAAIKYIRSLAAEDGSEATATGKMFKTVWADTAKKGFKKDTGWGEALGDFISVIRSSMTVSSPSIEPSLSGATVGGAGGGGTVNNNITQNFQGNVNPDMVKRATTEAVSPRQVKQAYHQIQKR